MAKSSADFKREFIRALMSRGDYTRQVNSVQYVTRCPFCGDTQKNLNTGHFYIRCDPSDNYSMVYNCFKCPASGIVDKRVIEKLGITDESLLSNIGTVNANSPDIKNLAKRKMIDGFRDFNLKLPPNKKHREKIGYLEDRLGIQVTRQIEEDAKIVTSLKEFLVHNKIGSITCQPYLAQKFEDNYIGFLSNGSSHLLLRDVTGREQISWVKYLIFPESFNNYVWYTMSGAVDIFTQDTIQINLAEGVFDTLGIAYNLHYDKPNNINVAVCGKAYDTLIRRLISQGFYGYNVVLNIFSDNDKDFNKGKNNYDTTLMFYRKAMKDYLPLFKEINVYYNLLYKDCGTRKENISLKRYRI